MKSLNWTGHTDASRRDPRSPGWLSRLIGRLIRGAVPVDGIFVPKPKQVRTPRPEPVRWGNFR